MSNPGEEFEEYIQFVYEMLLKSQSNNTLVTRRVDVLGSHGQRFNIDVYYEFNHANITHRVAIECKNTSRPIERDSALAFIAKLQVLPGTVGVFISRNGFQRGALQALEAHGVMALTGEDIPRFNQVIAQRLKDVWLPDSTASGRPFWALMKLDSEGCNTGRFYDIPVGSKEYERVLALFFSKRHGERWIEQDQRARGNKFEVRGLSQLALDVLIRTVVLDEAVGFVTLLDPGDSNADTQWQHRVYASDELAKDFLDI